jgi:hypothetical protein
MVLNYIYRPRLKSPEHSRYADSSFCYLYIVTQREMGTSNAVARAVYPQTLFEMTTIKARRKIAKREENKLKIMRTFE